MKALSRRARKQKYASHTAMYHDDQAYRQSCIDNGHPEWLQWADGNWAPEDGSGSRV